MNNAPRVVVRPSSISPEEASNTRARAWRFIFDCYERRRAADGSSGKDDMKRLHSEKGGHHDMT